MILIFLSTQKWYSDPHILQTHQWRRYFGEFPHGTGAGFLNLGYQSGLNRLSWKRNWPAVHVIPVREKIFPENSAVLEESSHIHKHDNETEGVEKSQTRDFLLIVNSRIDWIFLLIFWTPTQCCWCKITGAKQNVGLSWKRVLVRKPNIII